MDLVAWPVQREHCRGEFQKKRYSIKLRKSQALTWGLGTNTPSSIFSADLSKVYRWWIFLGDFYTVVFGCGEITNETFHDVQNANRRCTGHATMSTERGNYRLITVHAPFPTIAPNQKSLSNCCMEALSHWPEMKNSGRCSPWNFTKNDCTYKCHMLRIYRPLKVLLRPFSQTF